MTTEEFVRALFQRARAAGLSGNGCSPAEVSSAALLAQGRREGWLEAQDILDAQKPLERRHAARILHVYLRMILGEAEADDVTAASCLVDLYDCRVCVAHVSQMFVKGIMAAFLDLGELHGSSENAGLLFGQREPVSDSEARLWIERLFEPSCRETVQESKTAGV